MSWFWRKIIIEIIVETLKHLIGGKKHGMESTGKETTKTQGGTQDQGGKEIT